MLIMEILLFITFIAVIIVVYVLKARLSNKLKVIISSISGIILLLWFWVLMDGSVYWKIIVTVVVTGSLFTLFININNSRKNK